MQGYIKDYRKEVESDVWMMPPLYHRLWQWLKYNVNHDDAEIPMRDGTTLHIKRGQRLTSVRDIAKSIGWYEGVKWKEPNPKTISVILDWMVKKDMISLNHGQGNRQYTLITLVNWEVYNPKDVQGNSKVTPRTTDREHLAGINNNDLNDLRMIKNDEYDDYDKSPLSEIEIHFCQKRQRGFNVNGEDIAKIKEIIAYGIPVDFIKSSIDRIFAEFKPKHPKDYISTFSYCESGIYHDWHNHLERKKEATASKFEQRNRGNTFRNQSKPQKPNMPVYQAPSGKLEGEEKEELARVLKYLEEGA